MSYSTPEEAITSDDGGSPFRSGDPHSTTAASTPQINIRFHRSAATNHSTNAATRTSSLRPPGLPLPRLLNGAGMTGSSSTGHSPTTHFPSSGGLHTSSSHPISLSQALSAASASASPQPLSAVSSSPSHSSSFPVPPSRVRPRPRSSRPYQSLLKSASAEEASTSDDESSRWQPTAGWQHSQAHIPPYALMHGTTYMQPAYSIQQQPRSSLPNGSSASHNSPIMSTSAHQPIPPLSSEASPAQFASSLERPSYPQSRSRSNSFTSSSAAAASAAQSNASLSSPNHSGHPYASTRGASHSAEPSAVSALLSSARSLIGTLGISRGSPNSSPSANHIPSAIYSYQPVSLSSVGRPSTASPSASPLTLSHYSSAYPPPLPSNTHSQLPPIHDDDDSLDSDDDTVDGELRGLTGEDSDWSSDEEDDSPTVARHDKYGRQRSRNVRVIRLQCPSFQSLAQLTSSLCSSSMIHRCRAWCTDACCCLVSPDMWISTLLSVSWVKNAMNRYKELPWSTREKLMFVLSSTLGTILFLFLFESFMIVNTYDLEDGSHGAFTLSYLLAYVISIAWQHALHRLLVFQSQSYCLSLLHTYLSYSFSLVMMALLGTFLIGQLHISARLVACVTLPLSAVANYYLLRGCITVTERWQQAQVAAVHPSPITRPFFVPASQLPYAYSSQQQHQQQMDEYDISESITAPVAYPTPFLQSPSSDELSAIAISADNLSPKSVSPVDSVYVPYRSSYASHSQSSPAGTVLAYHSRAG